MTDIAIRNIMSNLESRNVDLKSMIALDFFARDGSWQTVHYASKVNKLYAWEINPEFENNLKNNLPERSQVSIGDSFEIAKMTKERFDLVVIDNPQGCFGEAYCEHFDALPVALKLISDDGIVIFNVKTRPYNYENNIPWQNRRNNFYGIESSNLQEDFIFNFYNSFISGLGFKVNFSFWEPRPQEKDLYAFVAKLEKRKNG